MQEQLRVSLVQTHLHWENPVANRSMFSEKLATLKGQTDLIVLPEMFTTGFTMNPEPVAELESGESLQWMIDQAQETGAAITGSIVIEDKGNYFNRLFFVLPDGSFDSYDKKHTFTLAGEHLAYKSGTKKLLVSYKGWLICPLICYDLRFPVWARNKEDYDLLIYTANWPEKRVSAWDALLKARAIENMSYCVGVNRVGLDGNGHDYVGHSAVYDVLGEALCGPIQRKESIETVTLEKSHVVTLRDRLQFLADRDIFQVE